MYSPFYDKYKEDKSSFVLENVDFLKPQVPQQAASKYSLVPFRQDNPQGTPLSSH
jgi:hypothetical protein